MNNQAYITTSHFGSKDLLENIDRITVLGVEGIWEASDDAPLYKVEIQHHGKNPRPILKPVDTSARAGMLGAMGNGVWAEVGKDIRDYITDLMNFPCPEMVSVHDRFETQESHDILCR